MVFRHEGPHRGGCRLGAYAHAGDHCRQRGRRQAHALLHGQEQEVYADAGYQGVEKRPDNNKCSATWHVAMKRGKRRALPNSPWGQLCEKIEKAKASIRSKVEHPFHVVKNLFGHRKARYRGLEKNTAQLFTLFGLANLVLARGRLLAPDARGAP